MYPLQKIMKEFEGETSFLKFDNEDIVVVRLNSKKIPDDILLDCGYTKAMKDLLYFLMKTYGSVRGYTHSNEIILVFKTSDKSLLPFGGSIFKMHTDIAVTASLYMSSLLPNMKPSRVNSSMAYSKVAFDCKVFSLPTLKMVDSYFEWRLQDSTQHILHLLKKRRITDETLKYIRLRKIKKEGSLDDGDLMKLPPRHNARIDSSISIKRTYIEEY